MAFSARSIFEQQVLHGSHLRSVAWTVARAHVNAMASRRSREPSMDCDSRERSVALAELV